MDEEFKCISKKRYKVIPDNINELVYRLIPSVEKMGEL